MNLNDPSGNIAPVFLAFAIIGAFLVADPANAPGPNDPTITGNGSGPLIGATLGAGIGMGVVGTAAKCAGRAICTTGVAASETAGTISDLTGCSQGDPASCGAALLSKVTPNGFMEKTRISRSIS